MLKIDLSQFSVSIKHTRAQGSPGIGYAITCGNLFTFIYGIFHAIPINVWR